MTDLRSCSFCNKDKVAVRHLFAHYDNNVAICDECIGVAATVMISDPDPEKAGVGTWFISRTPSTIPSQDEIREMVRVAVSEQQFA